jgi:Nitroreductase
MKCGPTWSNTLPLRVAYVTTPDGKARLLPHLQPGNVGKATQAPVNAILAVDSAFHHQIPRLFPFRAGMRDALEANPGLRDKIGSGGAWMQAAYFIIAVRAAGLAAGPMGGSIPQASMPSSSHPGTGGHSSSSTSATPARAPGTNACPGWTMPKPSDMPDPHGERESGQRLETRLTSGYRVGCQYESATLCNQHQARMSKQADAPVSMRPCLAGQGRGRCSS